MSFLEKTLKNGKILTIRPALPEDSLAIIDYLNVIAGESDNITFGPGSSERRLKKSNPSLENLQDSKNAIMVLGIIEGQICSVANVSGGSRPRTEHNSSFGITVLGKYWRQGIGKAVTEFLIKWAKNTQIIRKINLSVRTDNAAAISLYTSLGFEKQGMMTREMLIDSIFIDTVEMGKKIDP